jgi:anti-sigma regulatory factor (Ser/Thr protein kinase)
MIQSLEHSNISATFPASPRSAHDAREFVRTGLEDAGVDQPVLSDRLSLITSELVTNAILHAGSDIEVRIVIDLRDVVLEVIDDAEGRPRPIPPSNSETSGRGLILVDALADAWGVAEVEGGVGKMVWIRVSRS